MSSNMTEHMPLDRFLRSASGNSSASLEKASASRTPLVASNVAPSASGEHPALRREGFWRNLKLTLPLIQREASCPAGALSPIPRRACTIVSCAVDGTIGVLKALLLAIDAVLLVSQPLLAAGAAGVRTARRLCLPPLQSGTASRARVVVVGASFAGLEASKHLQHHSSDLDLTLITNKPYFEYTPGVLRCLVQPGHFSALACPLPASAAEVTLATATAIEDDHVQVVPVASPDTCQRVPFDHCLVTIGTAYTERIIQPAEHEMTLADRAATWHQAHQELVAASSVLVIGGGLVGVELAAEIAVALPHIAVSLVHPRADLCQELPPPAREYVLQWLRKHSVQVHLGRRVANMSVGDDEHDGECMLDDGTLLSYSLAYRCTGGLGRSALERCGRDSLVDAPSSPFALRGQGSPLRGGQGSPLRRWGLASDSGSEASPLRGGQGSPLRRCGLASDSGSLSEGRGSPLTRVQALGGAMSSPVGWSRYLGGAGGGEAQDEDVKGFYLRTRETLQVVGRHNLWAAGDAMLQERRGKEGGQVRQVKNAHTAEQTAKLAAVNIVRAIREDGGRRVGAERAGGAEGGSPAEADPTVGLQRRRRASAVEDDGVGSGSPAPGAGRTALVGSELLAYPEGLVGEGRELPQIYCVSLGPYDGVLVFNWLVVPGPVAAVFKWLVEWTKVASVRGRPVGRLFWEIADASSVAISNYLIKPTHRVHGKA